MVSNILYNQNQQKLFSDKKIFFIGFNKCGTSTLHNFMLANGINSWHWTDGKNSIALEIRRLSRTPGLKTYLDQATAFSDIGYIRADDAFEGNGYFREFHHLYPDAYFIFNDRDPQRWIASRCNHVNPDTGSMLQRAMAFYKANAEQTKDIWLSQYTLHRKIVLSYFNGNRNFLHFDIGQDAPEKLSEFLSPIFLFDLSTWKIRNKTPR